MNKKLLLILLLFVSAAFVYAQDKVDLTKKPDALPAESFKFPDYIETKLDNGVKVFIVEDHEQPTFSIRLLVPGGSALDGRKAGVADVMTSMVKKGAGDLSALDIANELDGIGANVSAATSNDYIVYSASGLKKHMKKVLKIFADVLIKPTFPEDEFEKLIPQMLAGLKNEKSNPTTLASKLSNMVVYGKLHPYGQFETEKSLKAITVDDLKSYFKAVIKPNNASIVVVGDVSKREIVKALNKALKDWKPGKAAFIQIPPAQSMPLGVYFINRPGSVQSTIYIASVAPGRKDPDWEVESLASAIMGGGFGSRLFRILREKYSYTYSPRARLSGNKYTNKFACFANVRNSVTDSSIVIMQDLLEKLKSEPSPKDEIGRIKKYRVGQYLMAFENPGFLAGLIQNADFNGIPMQRVKTWHTRYMNYSPYDVLKIAKRYMDPAKSFIVVVGAPEVREKLAKFGPIFDYNLDLEPMSGDEAKMESVSLDAEDLIEEYVDALGGKDALNSISSMTITAKALLTARGQEIPGKMTHIFKAPDKMMLNLDMSVFKQQSWCNGKQAWSKNNQGTKQLEGDKLEDTKFEALMFNDTKLLDYGYKCEVLGKLNDQIVMKVQNPRTKQVKTYYFDAKTYLISKIEWLEDTPQGKLAITTEYTDYKKINNISVPMKITTSNPMFSMTFDNQYKFNEEIDDSVFQPAE
jgi:predicted Zn-dependent peptidase/outer membrane lipoprotein-sorting protein